MSQHGNQIAEISCLDRSVMLESNPVRSANHQNPGILYRDLWSFLDVANRLLVASSFA